MFFEVDFRDNFAVLIGGRGWFRVVPSACVPEVTILLMVYIESAFFELLSKGHMSASR